MRSLSSFHLTSFSTQLTANRRDYLFRELVFQQRVIRAATFPHTARFPVGATLQNHEDRVLSVPQAVSVEQLLGATESPVRTLEWLVGELAAAGQGRGRLERLAEWAQQLPKFPPGERIPSNRVMGCAAQVWMAVGLDSSGRLVVAVDSDSVLSKGLAALLVKIFGGATPREALEFNPAQLSSLPLPASAVGPPSRSGLNLQNMLETMKRRVRSLTDGPAPRFPSLLLTADSVAPQGAFAQAQARFLSPGRAQVQQLAELLSTKKIGVVAHFYMDPEVQGVLTSARELWPHITISDSLVMADGAVKMAEAGCSSIAVLGVDFMSENVRAILDQAGWQDVKVYRMDPAAIGCSLAEAAESPMYAEYLRAASVVKPSVHVVYINTSLHTKATAHALVPTITCTSSNVVQTVLQAFAQVPSLSVWYGPDTYMGRNLKQLLTSLADVTDEEIRELHPDHTRASIRALLPRLHYFQHGSCIVHHMFGGDTCELVRRGYNDAFLTAHFEVPGEMFTLAMEAKARGRGVVGSTQNILDFITARVREAISQPFQERLQFVLGTESGMVTAIVRCVQGLLKEAGRRDIEVEVVFPVSPEAIITEVQSNSNGTPVRLPTGLQVLPGAAAGEGCSMEGGCASCPYMKMNSLAALMNVCSFIGNPSAQAVLARYEPRAHGGHINGKSIAQAGSEPILHMRAFQKTGQLPDALVEDILAEGLRDMHP